MSNANSNALPGMIKVIISLTPPSTNGCVCS